MRPELRHYFTRYPLFLSCALGGGVIVAGIGLLIPGMVSEAIELFRAGADASKIQPLAQHIAILAVLAAAFGIMTILSSMWVATKALVDIRHDILSTAFRQDVGFFREYPVGDLISRLTGDIGSMEWAFVQLLSGFASSVVSLVVALALMVSVDPLMALLAILQFPALTLIGKLVGKTVYYLSNRSRTAASKLLANIQRDLVGIETIKAFALEEERLMDFERLTKNVRDLDIQKSAYAGLMGPSFVVVQVVVSSLVIMTVGGNFVVDGELKIGQLVEFEMYLALMSWPIGYFGNFYSNVQQAKASWFRALEVITRRSPVEDGTGAPIDRESASCGLELDGIGVDLGDKSVLRDVHLAVVPGTTVAVVGKTGAGKSTLLRSILRLAETTEGEIRIAGRPVEDLPLSHLRGLIGYASQSPALLSSSIRANIEDGIREGHEDAALAPWQAAMLAGLQAELDHFPDGLDTFVGEEGVALSGGQRQRIALARTLVGQPPIVLLDNALSAVDAQTEELVVSQFRDYLRDKTCLLVSNRPGVVALADTIVVLDEGTIVERGTHEELLARGGLYAEIMTTHRENEGDDVE